MKTHVKILLVLVLFAFIFTTGFDEVPEDEESKWLIIEKAPEILQQLIVVLSSSGLAVFLGNLAKYPKFMKWMDGKTNVIVSIIALLILGAASAAKFFDKDLLMIIMPWLENDLADFMQIVNFALSAVLAIAGLKPIHDAVDGMPLLGKSFSK